MMTLDWQNVAALALLLMATSYVLFRAWKAVAAKQAGKCGGCGTCPTHQSAPSNSEPKAILQIDPPQRS